jgi:hypothetical protein
MSKTISISYNSGITLTSAADNPTTITQSGYVNGGLYVSSPGGWLVVNQGTITDGEHGVSLGGAGTVTNVAGGLISGVASGVYGGPSGAVTVVNYGLITGSSALYLASGGAVTNKPGGTLSGSEGILSSHYLSVVNAGQILGDKTVGQGIDLFSGGGAVTNLSGGTISGLIGVYGQTNGALTVVNTAHIVGSEAATNGRGVELSTGGLVSNLAGGTISGYTGILGKYGATTVVNAGSIIGVRNAVQLHSGYANLVKVDPGAVFNGTIDGGDLLGATVISTLELASASSAGALSGLGTTVVNFGSIVFDTGADWFIAGNTSGLAGTISGFAQDDTIEITGITVTGSSYSGGILTLTDNGPVVATLDLPGTFMAASQFLVTPVNGGEDVTLSCFRAGTRIGTTRGDVPVEQLQVGDQVVPLLGGKIEPIVWIGRRRINCMRHPNPKQVWPVRVAIDAFGSDQPHRDLFLSPDHAVFVDDVLIPIKHLINGTTITQVPVDEVTYFHIELSRHDVVLAQGLPAESYLDAGDRANFANDGGLARLFPDFSAGMWEAYGCAPLIVRGPTLDTVRRWVNARSAMLDRDPATAQVEVFHVS